MFPEIYYAATWQEIEGYLWICKGALLFQEVNFMELSSMDYLDLCHKYTNILMYFQDQDILLFLGMGEENYGPTRGNSRDTDGKDGNT